VSPVGSPPPVVGQAVSHKRLAERFPAGCADIHSHRWRSVAARAVLVKENDLLLVDREHRIEGVMHVLYNHRVLDVLNGMPEVFIPITAARIFETATKELVAERAFLAVNKQEIVFLYEDGPRSDAAPTM